MKITRNDLPGYVLGWVIVAACAALAVLGVIAVGKAVV